MRVQGRFTTLFSRCAALVASVFILGLAPSAQANESIKVQALTFPVVVNGTTHLMAGKLYTHGSARNRPLQILVHGATYTGDYWDLPSVDGQPHSYARYMARQKYAVLALDQLGNGASDTPEGFGLTLGAMADAAAQVAQQMRSGNNGVGIAFDQIVFVGHSMGSMVGIRAQAEQHPFDALVTTAMGHVPHPLPPLPDFCAGNTTGYFYFPEMIRAVLLFAPQYVTPEMFGYDSATFNEPISCGFLYTGLVGTYDLAQTKVDQVTGPALVQLSEIDIVAPSELADQEAAFWPQADVTVQTLPQVGHSVNASIGAQPSWERIDAWLTGVLAK
ncbi:MAG TPA: alpha/beta hydrolase [Myxococcaceae bacterium]|nr:alpha/beta hydrolase [Myxococcaceae bacterium]